MQQGDVCMMVVSEFDGSQPRLDRNFVLSPENQRRHTLSGDYELYGNDESQTLVCNGEVTLSHPEHGKMVLSGIVEVWATREMDHITQSVRAVID